MKYFVFLIAVLFVGCGAPQTQIPAENSAQPTPSLNPTMENSLYNHPNDFDKALPPKVREALENAEEIEILTLDENQKENPVIEKFVIGIFSISGNKITKIARDENRTQLLEAIYEDVRTGGEKAACFEPHHTIKVDYKGEKIAIAICFHCGRFVGIISNEQFGKTLVEKKKKNNKLKEEEFRGSFPGIKTSKSLPFFNKITGTSRL